MASELQDSLKPASKNHLPRDTLTSAAEYSFIPPFCWPKPPNEEWPKEEEGELPNVYAVEKRTCFKLLSNISTSAGPLRPSVHCRTKPSGSFRRACSACREGGANTLRAASTSSDSACTWKGWMRWPMAVWALL